MARRDEKPQDPTDAKLKKSIVLISEGALKALLRSDDKHKAEIDSITGELREEIANAVDKKHLNKTAYAMVKKLHRMRSDEQLHLVWHTFLEYAVMAGIVKRVEAVQDLPLADEDGEENGGTVVPMKAAE